MLASSFGSVSSSLPRTSANDRSDEIFTCSTAMVRDARIAGAVGWVMCAPCLAAGVGVTIRDCKSPASMSAPFSCTRSIRGLQSFSQSLCDEKGVGGLLQAPDLAVSDCPEMGESGLHPPPLLRNAEIVPENDHVIARLE